MENPFKSERWSQYLRPKPRSIVEYDVNRKEYVCWLSKLIIKGDIRWGKPEDTDTRPMILEKRFIIGYEMSPGGTITVHTLGSKGLTKDRLKAEDEMSFFVVRRPVIGPVFIVGLLVVACAMIGVDKVFEKLGKEPPFDI